MTTRAKRITAVLAAAAAWAAISCEGPINSEPAYKGPWKAYEVRGLPEGTRINDIYMFSPTDGWAVANGSRFLRFDGLGWMVHTDLSQESYCQYVMDLDFSAPNNGWAVGSYIVIRYDRGRWREIGVPPRGANCVFTLGGEDVWVGSYGCLYKYAPSENG